LSTINEQNTQVSIMSYYLVACDIFSHRRPIYGEC